MTKRWEIRKRSLGAIAALLLACGLFALPACSSGETSEGDLPAPEVVEDGDAPATETESQEEAPAEPASSAVVVPDSVDVKGSIEEYTWPELKAIANMMSATGDKAAAQDIATSYNLCEAGGSLTNMPAKAITLSDGTAASVRLVGIMQDTSETGEPLGMTFMFDEAVAKRPYEDSGQTTIGWSLCGLSSWLDGMGFGLLPNEMQQLVARASKATDTGSSPYWMWLPSYVELGGELSDGWIDSFADGSTGWRAELTGFNEEGEQYDLFRQSGCDSDTKSEVLCKTYEGEPCMWWERTSPNMMNDERALAVSDEGEPFDSEFVDRSLGIVPFFCL